MLIKTLPYLFKKPLKTFSLFLIILTLLISCNKEKLTKPTHTGAQTFSCKINGKIYASGSGHFYPDLTGGLSGTPGNYLFFCGADMYKDNSAISALYSITMTVNPNVTEGQFNISYGGITYHNGNYTYYEIKSGGVDFTFIDLAQKITSGTFSFTAVNKADPNDVITVSEGRFDMKN